MSLSNKSSYEIARKRIADQERLKTEEERKEKLKQIDNGVNQIESIMYEFAVKYGRDNPQTVLMTRMYDMMVKMQETVKKLDAIRQTTEVISNTVGFIDDSLDFIHKLFVGTNKTKYGFFEKRKRKREIRKSIRNMQNRMDTMADMIAGLDEFTDVITVSLEDVGIRMDRKLKKREAKRAKEAAKRGTDYQTLRANSEGNKKLDEYFAAHPEQQEKNSTTSSEKKSSGGDDSMDGVF